jgi:magnesium transporter
MRDPEASATVARFGLPAQDDSQGAPVSSGAHFGRRAGQTGSVTNGIKNGVRTRLWRDGRLEVEDFPIEDVSDHLQEEDALVWLDLCDPDHDLLLKLADELTLDPHAVEDAISSGERPKATRHATHTFVTVYRTRLDVGGGTQRGPLDSRLEISRVSAFVMPRGIVTVRSSHDFDMDPVVERWDDDPELLRLGPGALLHGLLDVVVDGHFETVQLMDDAIEALEDGLFDDHAVTREIQQRTYRVRKELVEMRRVILPMREVVNAVQRHRSESDGHRSELDGWYSDLYDHVLRVSEWTESLRDMVTTVFETNLSLQDARLNTVMKKLTGWAAIIAVPTAVTGWFGQNIPYPGFARDSGLYASAGVIIAMSGTLFIMFKRRGWL